LAPSGESYVGNCKWMA